MSHFQDLVLAWMGANPGPHTTREIAEGMGQRRDNVCRSLASLRRFRYVQCTPTPKGRAYMWELTA